MGARLTLVGAGVGGAAITLAALYLPGMRDVEREQPVAEPEPVAAGPIDVIVVATVVRGDVRSGVSARAGLGAGRVDPW